jgi:predicted DCC family thiol-disulfide oxidoreductase YuxK
MLDGPLVLYDGRCGLCRGWSRRLARWDGRGRLRQVPYQERHTIPGVPALSDADLEQALHVVLPDGRVERGARGVIALLPWLRGGRVLGWLAKIPGVTALAEPGYRWIARRRHDLGPGADHCALR